MTPAPALEAWLAAFIALAVEAALVVAVAALVARRLGPGTKARLVWQAGVVALLVLVAAELAGTGQSVGEILGRLAWRAPPGGGGHATVSLPGAESAPAENPATADLATDAPAAGSTPAAAAEAARDAGPAFEPEDPWPAPALPPGKVGLLAALDFPPAVAPVPNAAPPPAATGPREPPAAGVWWPGVVWAAGAGLVLARGVLARLLLFSLRRRPPPSAAEALGVCIERLAARLGIRRGVALREAAGLRSPVAFGVLRPTVVLPPGFARDYEAGEQEAILAHELAHLAAGDPAWQFAADLASAALWWHPLAWRLRSKLGAASEFAADEAAGLVENGPAQLAASLVALGRRSIAARRREIPGGLLAAAGGPFRSDLGRRVERLLGAGGVRWSPPGRRRSWAARTTGAAAMVCSLIVGSAWARPRAQGNLEEGGFDMKRWMRSSWMNSLAGMAIVAALGAPAIGAPPQEAKPQPDPTPPSVDPLGLPDPDSDAALEDREDALQELAAEIELLRQKLAAMEKRLASGTGGRTVREKPGVPGGHGRSGVTPPPPPGPVPPGGGRVPGPGGPPHGFPGGAGGLAPGTTPAPPGGTVFGGAGASGQYGIGPGSPPVLPGAGPPAPYHANVLEGGPGAGSPPSSAPIGHIDLVSLATHLSDAVGNLEIAKIHFENRSKQSKVGTTTTEAAALAEIQLKAAERKVLLLRRMAEAALRAAEAETHRLSQERQNLPSRILNDPGRAAAIRAVEAQLAAQEANLQILKLILAESRQEQ